jgi:hypothetical protein
MSEDKDDPRKGAKTQRKMRKTEIFQGQKNDRNQGETTKDTKPTKTNGRKEGPSSFAQNDGFQRPDPLDSV